MSSWERIYNIPIMARDIMEEHGNTSGMGRMTLVMIVLGAYLFCRVTGINARRERAIICIRLSLSLSPSPSLLSLSLSLFPQSRILRWDGLATSLRGFCSLIERGSAMTNVRFTEEMKYRSGAKCAFYQNESTAINGWFTRCILYFLRYLAILNEQL